MSLSRPSISEWPVPPEVLFGNQVHPSCLNDLVGLSAHLDKFLEARYLFEVLIAPIDSKLGTVQPRLIRPGRTRRCITCDSLFAFLQRAVSHASHSLYRSSIDGRGLGQVVFVTPILGCRCMHSSGQSIIVLYLQVDLSCNDDAVPHFRVLLPVDAQVLLAWRGWYQGPRRGRRLQLGQLDGRWHDAPARPS